MLPAVAYRIGMDLVDAQGVADAVARFGDRYLHRIYTERELAECNCGQLLAPMRLAARFAAKEATLKVLAMTDGVPLRSIEVQSGFGRPPKLVLAGEAADRAERENLSDFLVSLTHDGGMSAAVVLATVGRG